MSDGQHVGTLTDSVHEDADLGAIRKAQVAMKAAVLPRSLPKAWRDYGDGDRCPVENHGNMYVLRPSGRQWCPHSGHSRVTRA